METKKRYHFHFSRYQYGFPRKEVIVAFSESPRVIQMFADGLTELGWEVCVERGCYPERHSCTAERRVTDSQRALAD